MKNKIGLFSLAIVLFAVFSFGFNSLNPDKKPINLRKGNEYKSAWEKVDSFEKKGLPKSALEIVEQIYTDARKDNNYNQVIKSFIYKMKLQDQTEEDAFENSIYKLQNEIKTAKYPTKSIMHSMLAEMYWMYYQNNRYKFIERSAVQGVENKDIKTWDLNKLADVVIKEYLLSLENSDSLKRTSLSYFDVIVEKGENTETLRSSLYDFLANRAVGFFKNPEIALSRAADKFQLKEDFYFADAKTFANTKIVSNDTLSLQFYGIKILQDLTNFHLSDKNTDALIDLELERLKFIYSNSVNPNKDELYRKALIKLLQTYSNQEYSSNISYELGVNYKELGYKYNPNDSLTNNYKAYNKKAINIFETAIKKYPKSIGALKCKSAMAIIKNKELAFKTENVVPANKTFAMQISYKNIDTVYYKIGKISREKYNKIINKYYSSELYIELLKNIELVKESNIVLPKNNDFNKHSTEHLLNGLNYGFYVVFTSNSKLFNKNSMSAYSTMQVSNLSYASRGDNGYYELYILNRTTGEPESDVFVQTYYQKYNYTSRRYERKKGASYTSDKNGYVKITGNPKSYEDRTLDLKKADDFLSSDQNFYLYGYKDKNEPYLQTTIFTDRAIYRPGQTVYFKGIDIEYKGEERKIVTGNRKTVIFNDVNYQKIAELKLTTNEFGTFNGSFQIPTGVLNGQFQIRTRSGSKYIRVEEYKRPKFETKILPFTKNYRLNDEVEITGKATTYSGANLSDATVKYRITRSPIWRYWWWSRPASIVEVANGTVTTNEKGEYKIKFKALPDLKYKETEGLSFNYSISVDVTDINGETQSTTSSIRIGYVDLTLSTNISHQKVDINKKDTFLISAANLNGEAVNTKGKLVIYKLKQPKKALRNRLWSQPDEFLYNEKQWDEKYPNNIYKNILPINYPIEKQIMSIDFDTEKEKNFVLNNLSNWDLGLYKIVLQAKDAFGTQVKDEQTFTVYNPKTKKLANPEILSVQAIKSTCEPGETAEILIASSEKIKVLYEIEFKKQIIKKEFITLNNEQKLITIPIEEKYRGNIAVHFTTIYNNRFYTFNQPIVVPYTNKELDIEFQTFRNKLLPGEKEKWLMTVKGKNGDKVMSEMMLTMYDKSLDQFAPNYWGLYIWNYRSSSKYWSSGMFGTANSRIIYSNNSNYVAFPTIRYDKFNWFGFNYYSYGYGIYGIAENEVMYMSAAAPTSKGRRKSKKEAETMSSTDTGVVLEEVEQDAVSEKLDDNTQKVNFNQDRDRVSDKKLQTIKARTNFNETAFFYPELRTNENGELVVEFTVPESLTSWKIMGLATSKDLRIGYTENELITQKDLMVMPNPPRFFRQGDKIAFPLKISNISDKDLQVAYDIQFFDAITEKPLSLSKIDDNKITIPAKGNKAVSVMISIPDDVDAIKYRVVAKSGKFSDAEENVIPVLSNRMLVTESLPLPIRGNQTKTFKFEKLVNNKSQTLKNYKYTLEFTSNPAWYAVQALPYMMEYPYECAEQTFSRFYSNSLASYIANSSPKIKAVFDSWKNTPKSEALLSNLEKNQELKALMLEETPWVLQGKNESERKRRIGVLFDLNRMSNELTKALKKLKNMQSPNGGWPWFKGMKDNRFITQYIVSGMGHLDHLKVNSIRKDNTTWRMTVNAVKYLDNRIREDYNDLKKYYNEKEMKDDHISNLQIQYLYARSFFTDVVIDKRNKDAYDYYYNQAKKYWLNKSLYSQAQIALALNRSDEAKTGIPVEQEIMKSLKEKSITHDELGMYWKDNTAGYYWYQAPIETQAIMIEAFDEVAKDDESVENLKIWLLKQKQTQDWKTTKATAEAVYALLLKGNNLLASDKLVEITIGNKKIDPKKLDGVNVEAGTGYFKTSWSGGEINSDMGNITVSKKDDGIAWGAVYWQYFEDLDKITKHKTPLYIEKKLYVEKMTKNGKIIEPIDKNKIKVGDKIIVRIELRVDRDMEYVHMKDMRASGFEPINVISRYKWQDGLGYYETTKDASTNFFMDYLRKGTYVFEYPLRVAQKGDFSNGITTIQCMYAPEFTSHSEGIRVMVE